jgi:hypothetical protein
LVQICPKYCYNLEVILLSIGNKQILSWQVVKWELN